MSIADEARAEAARRYSGSGAGPTASAIRNARRGGFEAGADWQASRKVEAAPSDTDREALAWVDRHNDVWVFPGGGDTGYSFETQPFSREHIEKKWGPLAPLSRSQPVQVEVTDDMVERAARALWAAYDGNGDWESGIDSMHEACRGEARAALAAALGGGE